MKGIMEAFGLGSSKTKVRVFSCGMSVFSDSPWPVQLSQGPWQLQIAMCSPAPSHSCRQPAEKDAEHAGRRMLTARDVVEAFRELGTRVEELKEHCAAEACDMAGCAVHSAKRVEDLAVMRGASLSILALHVFISPEVRPTRPGLLSRQR